MAGFWVGIALGLAAGTVIGQARARAQRAWRDLRNTVAMVHRLWGVVRYEYVRVVGWTVLVTVGLVGGFLWWIWPKK